MKKIRKVKEYIMDLYQDMDEDEIKFHLGTDDLDCVQVIESSPTTWKIEKKVGTETYIPIQDETAIDMDEEEDKKYIIDEI